MPGLTSPDRKTFLHAVEHLVTTFTGCADNTWPHPDLPWRARLNMAGVPQSPADLATYYTANIAPYLKGPHRLAVAPHHVQKQVLDLYLTEADVLPLVRTFTKVVQALEPYSLFQARQQGIRALHNQP